MNEIELRQLRCLVLLAEERNFGRAAVRLHMSQPPLTRMVAEVERVLGAKLFERTTRRVALTPVGEVFIAEARDILARTQSAWETTQAAIRQQSGQLRLAYTPLALQTILPQLLTRFREQEHDARIDLVELAGDAQQNALENGHVDIAFACEPLPEEKFTSVLLHRQALGLLAPEGHRLAIRPAVSLTELAPDPLILHPRHEYPGYYDRVLRAVQKSDMPPPIYHREAGQNCLALVVGGKGVLLTSGPHTGIAAPGLCLIPLAPDDNLHEEIWGVWPLGELSQPSQVLTGILRLYAQGRTLT